jgi:hypothetical protein
MSHTPTILFPFEPEELLEKIRQLIRAELQAVKASNMPVDHEIPGLTQKPLYKAAEV